MITVSTTRNPLDHNAVTVEEFPSDGLPPLIAVLPDWARDEASDVVVRVNGQDAPRGEWDETTLVEGDFVEVVERPTFLPALILGAAKLGAGIIAKKVLITAAVKLVALFAINYLVSSLLAPKRPRVQRDSNESTTYGIGGIASEMNAEGAPIPVIYGEIRTGGVVINRTSRASQGGTEVDTLLLLGEGPVEAIGGITTDSGPLTSANGDLPVGLELDGQPASEFAGVTAYVRMGSNDQAAIPGFSQAEAIFEGPGVLLPTAETPNPPGAEITPQDGGFDPGDPTDAAELAKWDTELSFTMDTEADEFGVIINFEEGLWEIAGASIGANTANFQIRYQQVDALGVGFGNVLVLPPETEVSAATTSPYQVEFRHPFIDPETYTIGSPGGILTNGDVTGYGEIASPTGVLDQPSNDTQFSIGFWVRFDLTNGTYFPGTVGSTSGVGVGDPLHIAEQVSGNTGWRLKFEYESDTVTVGGSGLFVDRWAWILEVGDGSTFQEFRFTANTTSILGTGDGFGTPFGVADYNPTPYRDAELDDWVHVVFSFDSGAVAGTSARVRCWVNGAEEPVKTQACVPALAVTSNIQVCRIGGVVAFDGDMEQIKYWNRALISGEVATQYNGGAGLDGNGDETDLAWAIQFDDIGAGTQPDSSPNGNDLTFNGASIGAVAGGFIQTGGSGTFKRGLYRVEVIRLDDDDTGDDAKSRGTWAQFRQVEWESFKYPGRALLAVRVRYENGAPRQPAITVPVRGRQCPIWDQVSELFPSAPLAWTRNPAWVALDMLTNLEYGAGRRYALADMRLSQFQELADYADEQVYDGGRIFGGSDNDIYFTTLGFPSIQIAIQGVTTGIPDGWEVGAKLAITGATDLPTFDTPEFEGVTITAITYDAGLEQIGITADWPTPTGYPTPPGSLTEDTTAQVFRVEPRFEYDGTFDRANVDIWDAATQVLSTAYAAPIREGSRLSLFIDKPGSPVAMVTQANTIADSLEVTWVSQADRPNVAEADILDREANWRRRPVRREHPNALDDEADYLPRSYSLEGVTRRSQASRHLDRDLEAFYLLRRRATWRASLDSLPLRPGAIVRVANDILGWAPSGRFRDGCAIDELVLDRDIEVPSGDFAMYWQRAVDGTITLIEDATPSGSYAAGDTITLGTSLDAIPQEGDRWAHVSSVPTRQFRVISCTLNPDTFEREFEAIEYDERLYDLKFDELASQPTTLQVPGAKEQQLQVSAPLNVVNLRADTYSYEGIDGTRQTVLRVGWDAPQDQVRIVREHEVWLESAGGALTQVATVPGRESSALVPIDNLPDATRYRVRVRSVGLDGSARQVAQAPARAYTSPTRTGPRITYGDTLPAAGTTRDGDRHYYPTDAQWYYRDEARGLWLSDCVFSFNYAQSANFTSGTFLRIAGVQTSNTSGTEYGHAVPWLGTVVAATFATSGSGGVDPIGVAGIYADASLLGTIGWSGGARIYSSDALDWSVGPEQHISVLSGRTISGCYVNLHIRRNPS